MASGLWFSWSCGLALLAVGTVNSIAHVTGAGHSGQLRLSGGGQEMDMARAVERSATGVINADEAVNLRSMGFLKGPWQADSEIEPDSDVQDAHEAQWPEEWAGEEEAGDIMRLTSGPVRLYASNKYNQEVLPTGRVKPETMKRLAKQLDDDEAFQSVPIESGCDSSPETFGDGPHCQQDRAGTSAVAGGLKPGCRDTQSRDEQDSDNDIVASLSSAKPTEVDK